MNRDIQSERIIPARKASVIDAKQKRNGEDVLGVG
jgi:hypothetical protein